MKLESEFNPKNKEGDMADKIIDRKEKIKEKLGVGPTPEFNLRVSTGVLARSFFIDPETNQKKIILERKATLKKDGSVSLQAQPIGGASVLNDPEKLYREIGPFNYDSDKSKKNDDFRLQIRSGDWDKTRDFILNHFNHPETKVVEAGIERELAEEMIDAMGVDWKKESATEDLFNKISEKVGTENIKAGIIIKNYGPEIEGGPKITSRTGVEGSRTARVFNIQEVNIIDSQLIDLIKTSAKISDDELKQQIGPENKKATALTVIDFNDLMQAYRSNPEVIEYGREKPVYLGDLKISDNTAITFRKENTATEHD